MFLSIITPTYNRTDTLQRCYHSLVAQTDPDFEWIVVDDGSIDDTGTLMKQFQGDHKIKIRYTYQENGGKQRAHNTGVQMAQGELCICLDSDDALSPDAVETAKKIWKEQSTSEDIGILAKRGDFDKHKPICSDWSDELHHSRMLYLQEQYSFTGDTALFFKTDLMKSHRFKTFEGEKFIPEDSLYAQLDGCGTMVLSKRVLYYCEYLPDGLTANYRKLLLSNPMGTSYCYYQRMLQSRDVKNAYKNAIISQAYLIQANRKPEFACKKKNLMWKSARPFAQLYRVVKRMNKEV